VVFGHLRLGDIMARIPLSDDACDRLVAARDPIDAGRLRDEAVADLSRRLRDELMVEIAGQMSEPVPRRRERRFDVRRRVVTTGAAIAAVVVVGVLALLGFSPTGGDHAGPLDVPAASAAGVLDQAAQAALRSTSVVPSRGQYGFVAVQTGSVLGQGRDGWDAWVRMSEIKSDWYAANGSGRERIVQTSSSFLTHRDRAIAQAHGMTLAQLTATFPHVIDGAFAPRTLETAGFLPYWQMSRLPTQPAALRRWLERLLLASAGKAAQASLLAQMRRDPAGLFAPIAQFLLLPTSPQLRAALFGVLAGLPGVQLLGHQRDRLGRSGIAVAVTHGRPDRVREELLFDPATSNLRQIQAVLLHSSSPPATPGAPHPATLAPGTVLEYTDFLSRGVVDSITQLPGGRHLPLTPTTGDR
jgi:hypothetical protein